MLGGCHELQPHPRLHIKGIQTSIVSTATEMYSAQGPGLKVLEILIHGESFGNFNTLHKFQAQKQRMARGTPSVHHCPVTHAAAISSSPFSQH